MATLSVDQLTITLVPSSMSRTDSKKVCPLDFEHLMPKPFCLKSGDSAKLCRCSQHQHSFDKSWHAVQSLCSSNVQVVAGTAVCDGMPRMWRGHSFVWIELSAQVALGLQQVQLPCLSPSTAPGCSCAVAYMPGMHLILTLLCKKWDIIGCSVTGGQMSTCDDVHHLSTSTVGNSMPNMAVVPPTMDARYAPQGLQHLW
jgi:hypothetical protein